METNLLEEAPDDLRIILGANSGGVTFLKGL
ncbi:hypothetical protein COLO4_36621 [Corchorus olitorius]|uniref:Uncharacterized protein n=1 Tax=Corchorus olitorius TaxID=93759 RepID=A0A1R3G789_9ROSI|nr:hypothetical protein COLO4_36621 [Corchorus olitorius]